MKEKFSIQDVARLGDATKVKMQNQLIEQLTRALSVLYFGSEDVLRYLAENEFSGCSGTQRECLTELHDYLISYRKTGC